MWFQRGHVHELTALCEECVQVHLPDLWVGVEGVSGNQVWIMRHKKNTDG